MRTESVKTEYQKCPQQVGMVDTSIAEEALLDDGIDKVKQRGWEAKGLERLPALH